MKSTLMDPDGGNPRRITNDPATDREPTCSPDGKKIAFWSDRAGNLEVFIMDIDGGNPRKHNENSRRSMALRMVS